MNDHDRPTYAAGFDTKKLAVAEKRIKRLYDAKAKAEAPIKKRLDANSVKLRKAREMIEKAHRKELEAFNKRAHKMQDALLKRLSQVDASFEKRISAIARKGI